MRRIRLVPFGPARQQAIREWLSDLEYSLRWYARYRVWSVPTRRWSGPNGSSRWPLPEGRSRRRARRTLYRTLRTARTPRTSRTTATAGERTPSG